MRRRPRPISRSIARSSRTRAGSRGTKSCRCFAASIRSRSRSRRPSPSRITLFAPGSSRTMSSANPKHVLCTGIAVLDMVFRVPHFPRPDVKTQATAFSTINGGNGANAAVAIAHLGARASFAGPLGGPAGVDAVGDTFLGLAANEKIDCPACPRVAGVPTSISAITIDDHGERAIANFRDERLSDTKPDEAAPLVADADAVRPNNRFPALGREVLPPGRKRGIPPVPAADEPRHDSDDLLSIASQVVF